MVTIGGKTVVSSFLLLIQNQEEAVIDLNVEGWKSKIYITFTDIGTEPTVAINPVTDGVKMIFNNWNNALGQSLKEAAELLSFTDGSKLYITCSNYRIIGTNQFHIQFLRSAKSK